MSSEIDKPYILFPENYLKGVKVVHDMGGYRMGFTKQMEKPTNDLLIVFAIVLCFVVVGAIIVLIVRFNK